MPRAAWVAVAVSGLLAVATPVGSAAAGGAVPALRAALTREASAAGLTVRLGAVSPLVAGPSDTVTITGSVANGGAAPVAAPTVTVRTSVSPVVSRGDVDRWAAGTGEAQGPVIGQVTLKTAVAPGGSAPFTVTVAQVGSDQVDTWGAEPVGLSAGGPSLHTFLGYQRVKEYQPLRVALAVPLVLDPDADLYATGPARAAAWQTTTGAGSRLARLIAATAASTATWLVDPFLVTPAAVPAASDLQTSAPTSASVAPGASPPASYAATAAEAATRNALAQSITAAAAAHAPIVLPMGDPDVAAARATSDTAAAMASAVTRAKASTTLVNGSLGVAWPAEGSWSPGVTAGIRAAYGSNLTAILMSGRQLGTPPTLPTALRTASDGTLLVATDPGLDTLLTGTHQQGAGPGLVQLLLAHTAAVLKERPGTKRDVVGVAPRLLDPDPTALADVLAASTHVPWLAPIAVPAVLTGTPADGPAQVTSPVATPPTRLDASAAARVGSDSRRIRAVATVRGDGAAWLSRWSDATTALLATAWRDRVGGWSVLATAVHRAGESLSAGVHVAPRQINFLADTGRIQLVVVNDLAVPVSNLVLSLVPSSPILRLHGSTVPLSIAARSRTTVTLRADALAAGQVPVRAILASRDGTVLSESAPVGVHVTPTGNWIYWVLGGVGALLLLAGIARSRTRRHAAA